MTHQLCIRYTLVMLTLFTTTFVLWILSYIDIQRNGQVDLPRAEWSQFDLSLISEALFSVAFLFAFGRLMYYFLIAHSFGPLLVSVIGPQRSPHMMCMHGITLSSVTNTYPNVVKSKWEPR